MHFQKLVITARKGKGSEGGSDRGWWGLGRPRERCSSWGQGAASGLRAGESREDDRDVSMRTWMSSGSVSIHPCPYRAREQTPAAAGKGGGGRSEAAAVPPSQEGLAGLQHLLGWLAGRWEQVQGSDWRRGGEGDMFADGE